MVVGGGTGLAALHRNAPASIRAGHVGGKIEIEELVPRRGAVRGVSGGSRANCEDLAWAGPAKRELGLEDLGVRVRHRALASGGSRVVPLYSATNS